MIKCSRCGEPTGPAFGLCANCIREEDEKLRLSREKEFLATASVDEIKALEDLEI